ncbi:nuclear transport factor 2 family protein [Tomitella biformata]|uniref:nuclear transport factor 2 family protein n=1 Tax=Tomitella biformata TaxID=630403 RepID=UPI000463C018|nr:nuclear transport factor 2 family protein [Tomitella biformata]
MTHTENSWIRDYYAAWDSGDVEAITAWLDDAVVLEDVAKQHIVTGAAEAREFVAKALKLVPGATYEVVTAMTCGEDFAAEWVMHPVGLRGSSVGTFRNGKVVGNRDYWNAAPTG